MSRNSILPALVGQNRHVVRIPLHEGLALLHRAAVGLRDDRTDDDVVALDFAALFVMHGDRAVLVQRDPVAVERLHGAQIVELHRAVVLRLDDRLLEGLARGAADVEGPHRQLRAGLADRLRGDDADRFAQLHKLAGREVAAVAMRANAAPGFAGQDGANLEALDADLFDRRGDRLVDQLIRLDDFLLRHRIDHRFAAHATDDAGREIDHFFVAFVDRAHGDAVDRSAIHLVDDHVLRRIDQLSRQVTGVGGLERGVGQTFARAVGGDEIFEHGQDLRGSSK